MPLLACPAVNLRGLPPSLLDMPAVAPFFNGLLGERRRAGSGYRRYEIIATPGVRPLQLKTPVPFILTFILYAVGVLKN